MFVYCVCVIVCEIYRLLGPLVFRKLEVGSKDLIRNSLYIFVWTDLISDTVYFLSGGTCDCPTISATKFDDLIKMVIAGCSPRAKVCVYL